jgi:ribulose-5-phosphate 4-epimerase/fuculose-1-phosphate aldolase
VIRDIIQLARSLAEHPSRMVLWDEGSCAVKLSADRFLVTRRGATLARVGENDIVEMNLHAMAEIAAAETATDEELIAARIRSGSPEPSTDAALYGYLFSVEGAAFAAHTHPVEVNQILCSPRARQFADRRALPGEVVACGVAALLAPYADPGPALAREVRRKMHLWRDRHKIAPRLVLIQNHGMIVLGDSHEDLLKTIDLAIKSARIFVGASLLGGPVFLTPGNIAQVEPMKNL